MPTGDPDPPTVDDRPFITGDTATGVVGVCDGVSDVHGEGTKSLTLNREHWPAGAEVVVGDEASRLNSERRKRWNWAAALMGGPIVLDWVAEGFEEGEGSDGGREVRTGEAEEVTSRGVGGFAMV